MTYALADKPKTQNQTGTKLKKQNPKSDSVHKYPNRSFIFGTEKPKANWEPKILIRAILLNSFFFKFLSQK